MANRQKPARGGKPCPPSTAEKVDKMNKPKLVMVGNGMAGVRALEELFKLAPDAYHVTVFGAEPHPNYNRILLSPVLASIECRSCFVNKYVMWIFIYGSCNTNSLFLSA